MGPKKETLALSHLSAPVFILVTILTEFILAFMYNKADLLRILKIFSKTKGQEAKTKVSYKQPFKAKVFNVYFKKYYMDSYYFC